MLLNKVTRFPPSEFESDTTLFYVYKHHTILINQSINRSINQSINQSINSIYLYTVYWVIFGGPGADRRETIGAQILPAKVYLPLAAPGSLRMWIG